MSDNILYISLNYFDEQVEKRIAYTLQTVCNFVGCKAIFNSDQMQPDLTINVGEFKTSERVIGRLDVPRPDLWCAEVNENNYQSVFQFSKQNDQLLLAFLSLTGSFEINKDMWGVPVGKDSILSSDEISKSKNMYSLSQTLVKILQEKYQKHLSLIPRWPDGKTWAFSLSHDVDAPFSNPQYDFRLQLVKRQLKDGKYLSAGGHFIKSIYSRFVNLIPGRNDPNFGFEYWMNLVDELGMKTCFYIPVVNSLGEYASQNDVAFCYDNKKLENIYKVIIKRGHEIGLHPSINAKFSQTRIHTEMQKLHSSLPKSYKISGVRHHFWSLDNIEPEQTLAIYEGTSLKYDSSLGLNDIPGLRRGIPFPYFNYSLQDDRTLDILEVPPSLMDGGIFYEECNLLKGIDKIKSHIQSIRSTGGLCLLNWHVEQSNHKRLKGAGYALEEVLRDTSLFDGAWLATPGEIADWINKRNKLLE